MSTKLALPEFAEILKRREAKFQNKVDEAFRVIATAVIDGKKSDSVVIETSEIAEAVCDRFVTAGWPAAVVEKLVDDERCEAYKVWKITFRGL
jgi:hypothetical protein